jgi:hypothetical protein
MLKCGLQPSDGIVEHNITRHAMTVVNIALWLMEFYGPLINLVSDDVPLATSNMKKTR